MKDIKATYKELKEKQQELGVIISEYCRLVQEVKKPNMVNCAYNIEIEALQKAMYEHDIKIANLQNYLDRYEALTNSMRVVGE